MEWWKDFGETGNVVADDILPYRDIPTEDIFRAYCINSIYFVIRNKK